MPCAHGPNQEQVWEGRGREEGGIRGRKLSGDVKYAKNPTLQTVRTCTHTRT